MKKVFFHVVKSVKGGCGKSTYSFLLAEHLRRKHQNTAIYIVDLDICGTSWETDYMNSKSVINYITHDKNIIYVNDIVKCYRNIDNRIVWLDLDGAKVVSGETQEGTEKIKICISDPKRNKELSTYEVDLFENAISYLIEQTVKKESKNDIHFIFDMPPSSERHAEQVFRGLILDQRMKSILKDVNAYYEVDLYLLSVLDVAHIQSNIDYLKYVYTTHSITDYQNELNSEERLKVLFVINDVAGIIEEYDEAVTMPINTFILNNIANLKLKNLGKVTLNHMNIPHKRRALIEEMTPNLKPAKDYAKIEEVIGDHTCFSITGSTRIMLK